VLKPQLSQDFYFAILPIIIITLGSLAQLVQTFFKKCSSKSVFCLQISCLALALFSYIFTFRQDSFLNAAILHDLLSLYSGVYILVFALALSILFYSSHLKEKFFSSEISCLFLLSNLGLLVMTTSYDFVTLFIGLELSSMASYILVGYIATNRLSYEGSIKYLILGALSTGILLFGIALLYTDSGSLNIKEMINNLTFKEISIWSKIGAIFVLCGLSFKISLVPFHMWSPDAYQAAPAGTTAFMAVSMKLAIFILTLRIYPLGEHILAHNWTSILITITILSMIIGNILALVQTSLKRMLAYSSIAHSGYITIAICSLSKQEVISYQAILFYLISYGLSSLAIFACLMFFESKSKEDLQLEDFKGLAKSHPWISVAIAISLFSFAGFPPTSGFIAKFIVFTTALNNNQFLLVITGVLTSAISLYYYLRVIVYMFMNEDNQKNTLPRANISKFAFIVVLLSVLGSLALGTIFPGHTLNFLEPAAQTPFQQEYLLLK
jgi:NADH-quinone oxidoreductase subunit N